MCDVVEWSSQPEASGREGVIIASKEGIKRKRKETGNSEGWKSEEKLLHRLRRAKLFRWRWWIVLIPGSL